MSDTTDSSSSTSAASMATHSRLIALHDTPAQSGPVLSLHGPAALSASTSKLLSSPLLSTLQRLSIEKLATAGSNTGSGSSTPSTVESPVLFAHSLTHATPPSAAASSVNGLPLLTRPVTASPLPCPSVSLYSSLPPTPEVPPPRRCLAPLHTSSPVPANKQLADGYTGLSQPEHNKTFSLQNFHPTPGGRPAELPHCEAQRLECIADYHVLDTPKEPAYDQLTKLAANICQTPIALISLLDDKRQWFKSRVGLDADETPKDQAFCAHAILNVPKYKQAVADTEIMNSSATPGCGIQMLSALTDCSSQATESPQPGACSDYAPVFLVPNALEDERFAMNPLVTGAPYIRFYAGVPLITGEGHALGTLCVIDVVPRQLDHVQLETLQVLANQVVAQMELRRQVSALKKTQQLLTVATRDAEEGQQAAQAANSTKSQFLANVSHEIRTPLNGILLSANLLFDTNLSATQLDYVNTITSSGEHLLSIINDVLDYSKQESGLLQLEEITVDVVDTIESALELSFLPKHDIECIYIIEKDVPRHIVGDVVRIRQVIVNLISNACKFTRQGQIVLRVAIVEKNETSCSDVTDGALQDGEDSSDGFMLQFSVQDTGIGMSANKMSKLFRAFTQLDASTTREYGGTGKRKQLLSSVARSLHGSMHVVVRCSFCCFSCCLFCCLRLCVMHRSRFSYQR